MRRTRPDQAEGLRQLLSSSAACRVVALAAVTQGMGKRTMALNLATTLAADGRRVVLLQGTPNMQPISLPEALSAIAQTTQQQSTRRLCTQLDNVATALHDSAEPTVVALAAPELFLGLELWRAAQRALVHNALQRITEAADIVLIDTPIDTPCTHARALGAEVVTLVVTPSRAAITATYQMLKAIGDEADDLRFQVIVNKAQNGEEARQVFDNIAYTVRRYLSTSIDFLGHLPRDHAFRRSANNARTVIEILPKSHAAQQLRQLANHLLVEVRASEAAGADSLLLALQGEFGQASQVSSISH